jgi:ABC-type branched-subunit amino acid transport system substrate-binding protein
MNVISRTARTRSLLLASLFFVATVAGMFFVPRIPVAKAQSSQEGAARGRRIYFAGEDGTTDEVGVSLGGDGEVEAPATAFACASCHGERGEGGREGGLSPPPLTWEVLAAPRVSGITGKRRGPYDEASLTRAIRHGLSPSGELLHPAMPRYHMTARQIAGLVSYLKVLGTDADADPGVTARTIKVGAALPLSGPRADIGVAARQTLIAYFEEVNAQGGIYGRRIEPVFEDSTGDAAGTLSATRRLIEQRGVFAIVGSFEPSGDDATGEYLKRQAVTLVGPLTLSPKPSSLPNASIFYLLPTAADQARTLVEYARAELERAATASGAGEAAGGARLALVAEDAGPNREAAAAALSQALARGMSVKELSYKAGEFSAKRVADELASVKPEYIFFFGGPRELVSLSRALDEARLEAKVAGLALTVGGASLELPASRAARTLLAYPTPPPGGEGFAEFVTLLRRSNAGTGQVAFRAMSYGAAKTFVEALKMNGRRLSRAGLVRALENLDEFETGVLPPLSFGANRRVGASGAYVVGVDVSKKQFTPLSGWLALGSNDSTLPR